MLDELKLFYKKDKKILELLLGASNKGLLSTRCESSCHTITIIIHECIHWKREPEILWCFPLDANSKSRLVNFSVCAIDISLYQIVVIPEFRKQNNGVRYVKARFVTV